MLLGLVAGTLVASRKDEGLHGQKFLVVRELGVDGAETGSQVVAADSVGAGVGEVVSSRLTLSSLDRLSWSPPALSSHEMPPLSVSW